MSIFQNKSIQGRPLHKSGLDRETSANIIYRQLRCRHPASELNRVLPFVSTI